MNSIVFSLPALTDLTDIQQDLQSSFHELQKETVAEESGILIDNFIGEISARGMILCTTGDKLILLNPDTGRLLTQPQHDGFRFTMDLEPGVIRDALAGISKIRALLSLGEISLRHDRLLVMDDELKTVARIHLYLVRHGEKKFLWGATEKLKGYDQAHDQVIEVLRKGDAMELKGREKSSRQLQTGSYCSSPHIALLPDTRIKASVTEIINTCLTVARKNEFGIIADFDSEFLHDYRVNLRKVRSIISLLKGVYTKDDKFNLKKEFSGIQKETNRLRDLDVYLLEKDTYLTMVPPVHREGLLLMFDVFGSERNAEQKKVAAVLDSEPYRTRMAGLEKMFADESVLPSGPKANMATGLISSRLILKHYNKVCSIAMTIEESTPDPEVHRLRLQCKKLRYLMEFFSPLYPQDKIKTLIKALKSLQNNLGSFNDYSVQQESLADFLSGLRPLKGGRTLQLVESIGALRAMLHQRQLHERSLIMDSFRKFHSVKVQDTVAELFPPP